MRGGTVWRSVVRAVGAAASAVAGAANVAYCSLASSRNSSSAGNCEEAPHHHQSCDDCCTDSSSSSVDASFVVLQPALQPLDFSTSEPESSPRPPLEASSEHEATSTGEDWIEPPPYNMSSSPSHPFSPALMEAFSRLQQNSQGQVSACGHKK